MERCLDIPGEGAGEADLLSEKVVVGESGRFPDDLRQPKKPDMPGDLGRFES